MKSDRRIQQLDAARRFSALYKKEIGAGDEESAAEKTERDGKSGRQTGFHFEGRQKERKKRRRKHHPGRKAAERAFRFSAFAFQKKHKHGAAYGE